MKMRIMSIAMFFVVLMISFSAVSAAESNCFTNVNMINSGTLNVNTEAPDNATMAIQGGLSFKGIQYVDYAAVKAKWADSIPASETYFIILTINYVDTFGDIADYYEYLYVTNGTSSSSDVMSIHYMDLSKPANVTIEAYKISNEDWGAMC
jgi:hypothetical protein